MQPVCKSLSVGVLCSEKCRGQFRFMRWTASMFAFMGGTASVPSHESFGFVTKRKMGRRGSRPSVRLKVRTNSGVKVLVGQEHWLPVAEGDCVVDRRGGEQPEAKDQS